MSDDLRSGDSFLRWFGRGRCPSLRGLHGPAPDENKSPASLRRMRHDRMAMPPHHIDSLAARSLTERSAFAAR